MILPDPGAHFAWREHAPGPALVCVPLEAVARHLFTTRAWSLGATRAGSALAWTEIAAAVEVPPDALVRARQVHGVGVIDAATDRVASPGAAHVPALRDGDIVLAGESEVAVAVQGADCVPLLFADARLGAVAAAHAGWRGLASRVPQVAVQAMRHRFGSRPDDLLVALGPSIGSCCYEVGGDVRAALAEAGFTAADLARWFYPRPTSSPHNRSMPGLRTEPRPEHWYFDTWACVRDQLIGVGVRAGHVWPAQLCTASHPQAFPSYRREGISAGRIAGVIRPAVPGRGRPAD